MNIESVSRFRYQNFKSEFLHVLRAVNLIPKSYQSKAIAQFSYIGHQCLCRSFLHSKVQKIFQTVKS